MTRKERFAKVCDDHLGIVPGEDDHHDYSGTEDAAEYLYGDHDWKDRYVLVTTGSEYAYLYPLETLDSAAEQLGFSCGDSTFGEGPRCIVDLDTGEELWPQWQTLQWKTTSAAPTAH